MSSGSQTNMLRWREKAISTQEAQIKAIAAVLSRLVPAAASISWEHVAREVLEAVAAEAAAIEDCEQLDRIEAMLKYIIDNTIWSAAVRALKEKP